MLTDPWIIPLGVSQESGGDEMGTFRRPVLARRPDRTRVAAGGGSAASPGIRPPGHNLRDPDTDHGQRPGRVVLASLRHLRSAWLSPVLQSVQARDRSI